MGSLVFDFLNESLLFDDSFLASDFKGVSEADLSNELDAYREHVLDKKADLEAEISGKESEPQSACADIRNRRAPTSTRSLLS